MAKPIYKEGFLAVCSRSLFLLLSLHLLPIIRIHRIVRILRVPAKATIVTFVYGKVRIVQATCDPSETNPMFTLTLRAVYDLGKDNYDRKVAFDILKWIFCPPEPAKELAIRGKQ
ncbi:hypothetical protein CIHG_10504 [Coccidioides immitis H538.4]|uniref:Uncharacterized protein n=1 Tax=Coccidioides immitis H538.4 TaxID=396776 RepID=A0A0J8UXS0_COCIT|nr:hypothetical protein CIHG_10504 [Coccidioides immitis H538.4]